VNPSQFFPSGKNVRGERFIAAGRLNASPHRAVPGSNPSRFFVGLLTYVDFNLEVVEIDD
jgi:hypothetical protein